MKYIFSFFLLFVAFIGYSQKDSLEIGDKYWEDQFYININYNVLHNQPSEIGSNGFSYGFSVGYIKDIPFTTKGNSAFGIGLGYGFDSFNHGLKVSETSSVFDTAVNISDNKIKLHSIEMPIQFRWRTSTATKYSFFRCYLGATISYNFSNTFRYTESNQAINLSNIQAYNNWQTGLTMSIGYGTFNFYGYYGLSPLFKEATLNGNKIDTRMFKLGLSFYLL